MHLCEMCTYGHTTPNPIILNLFYVIGILHVSTSEWALDMVGWCTVPSNSSIKLTRHLCTGKCQQRLYYFFCTHRGSQFVVDYIGLLRIPLFCHNKKYTFLINYTNISLSKTVHLKVITLTLWQIALTLINVIDNGRTCANQFQPKW